MNIFQSVKAIVTTREAAEHYGLEVKHNGMTLCLFHRDRHPSLKVDERYYCFGCQKTGDVIDFTAKLFDIGSYEAARKLSADFDVFSGSTPSNTPCKFQQPYKCRGDDQTLADYLRLLRDWKLRYAPVRPQDRLDDRYVEACHMMEYIEYLIQEGEFQYEQRAKFEHRI